MRHVLFAAIAIALTSPLASVAMAQDAEPARVGQTSLGPVLMDVRGMTLYTFSRDMAGYSNCNGQCAVDSPPLLAPAGAKAGGAWSIIVRDDGRQQWAYKGSALYRWSKDATPGDTKGDGAGGGKWRVAKP